MTRLADPAGTPLDANAAFTSALRFDPSGTYLAQVASAGAHGTPTLHLYRRDGDTLTRLPDPPAPPDGPPLGCWWHPDGTWLLVGLSPYGSDSTRLAVYHRDGDTLTVVGQSPASVYGVFDDLYGSLAFDATGGWIALANSAGQGTTGLASFSAGTITLTDGDTSSHSAYGVAWNPTDATQLARVDDSGGLQMWRRDGDTLAADGPRQQLTSGQVLWHPGGTVLLGNDLYNGAQSGPMIIDRANMGNTGYLGDFVQVLQGYTFDASGAFFAGGPAVQPDDGGGCGGSGGTYLGLTVAAVTAGTGPDGATLTATMLDRMGAADQAAGARCTFATGTGGALYLAASGEAADNWGQYLPWGLRLYRIDTAAPSSLYMKQPDGSYALVGVDGQPLSFRLPDGSLRTWPGSGYPLFEKQADGTWKKVLG